MNKKRRISVRHDFATPVRRWPVLRVFFNLLNIHKCTIVIIIMQPLMFVQALTKILQLVRQDLERERHSKQGLDTLANAAMHHSPGLKNDDSNNKNIYEKLNHVSSENIVLVYMYISVSLIGNGSPDLPTRLIRIDFEYQNYLIGTSPDDIKYLFKNYLFIRTKIPFRFIPFFLFATTHRRHRVGTRPAGRQLGGARDVI